MNSKSKGNIGEAIVLAEFVKYGIQVSIPFGDNARYDLIADFNGKLNKIQVKYCGLMSPSNSVICKCASSTYHTTNKKYITYEGDIDYFCFYIPLWGKVLLVPMERIRNRKTINFRKSKPKNNQSNVLFVDEYTFDKTLCVETLYDEPKE